MRLTTCKPREQRTGLAGFKGRRTRVANGQTSPTVGFWGPTLQTTRSFHRKFWTTLAGDEVTSTSTWVIDNPTGHLVYGGESITINKSE
ncbi:hypothetical protein RUM43_010423 [Polyplax serrata]|uniref:Uncharacterized protein n=1 Tax=Polyplax serrata TaxID=468196 RepID=A0AAN8S9Z5_POLSC